MKRTMIYVLLTFAAWALYSAALGVYSWQRPDLGIVDGRLRPCDSRPNCVCSQGSSAERTVAALPIEPDAPAAAFDRARDCVETLPRVALVEAAPGYARYECCSRLFRFADDVELLLDEPAGVIHVRSASRVGYSDMGVNRKRVEEIRKAYGG
jgi:uncharacterized protein (DUF1499 family)